ncbi:MAG: hypothetical protein H6867_05735 [Rhodospirillales bacterium]|nr:hypothetical protein [Rhodospirillales bacterium]MCB9995028.1 hypothetical protein [Rhodospirillales bacterium]
MKRHLVSLALLMLLSACTGQGGADYRAYLTKKGVTEIAADEFSHCRGYGCRYIDSGLTLTKKDWEPIKTLFKKPADNAAEERTRIAQAIGLFEQKTGAITGTDQDIEGTYRQIGDFQHDCVDESVNTTIYLSLLEQQGLLQFHDVAAPTARLPVVALGLGPHQTAVIAEKDSGTRYAVDSWFHNNGQPAEIVALERWFFGWRPKTSHAPNHSPE